MPLQLSNGWRLDPDIDLFRFCDELRGQLNLVYERQVIQLLASFAVNSVDEADDTRSHRPVEPLVIAWKQVKNYQGYTGRWRFTAFFHKNMRENELYAIIEDHSNEEYRQCWAASPFVEEFAYWEHYPRPEWISAEEWEQRRSSWMNVISTYSLLEEQALKFQFMSEKSRMIPPMFLLMGDPEEQKRVLAPYLPNFQDRAIKKARALAQQEAREKNIGNSEAIERYVQRSIPDKAKEVEKTLTRVTIDDIVV